MLLITVFLCLFLENITAEDVGDTCVPNEQLKDGKCTLAKNCQEVIDQLNISRRHNFYTCGFQDLDEIVCCPLPSERSGDSPEESERPRRIADNECTAIQAKRIANLDPHIIGGEKASIGEFPFMVALGYALNPKKPEYTFECGGSLISPDFVLTAAHCIKNLLGVEPTIVRTGVVELGKGKLNPNTDVAVAENFLHPNFKLPARYHDLALLKLKMPVIFSSVRGAVCLDTSNETPTSSLIVTGWGTTSNERKVLSDTLMKANLSAVATTRCASSYTYGYEQIYPRGLGHETLCAGDPGGVRDACKGDSGGPLLGSDGRGGLWLVGVTSYGRGCGSSVPGLYVRVAEYLDWIESKVWPRPASLA